MTLTQADVGRIVMYHGPSDRPALYGEHLRVLKVHEHGDTVDGFALIGHWATLEDGFYSVRIPQAMLSPVGERCICDVCDRPAGKVGAQ